MSSSCNHCNIEISSADNLFCCSLCNYSYHRQKQCSGFNSSLLKEINKDTSSKGQILLLCVKCKGTDVPNYLQRFKSIEQRLDSLESAQPKALITNDLCSDLLTEMEERKNKKDNVVIFGIPEAVTGTPVERKALDSEVVNEICDTLNVRRVTETPHTRRLGRPRTDGKPRPVWIKFGKKDRDIKQHLLEKSRELKNNRESKFSKVFIKVDLTQKQIAAEQVLREELKRRRDAKEDVIIRNGRVIPRPTTDNKPQ